MVGICSIFLAKTVLEIIDGGTKWPPPKDWVFGMALNVEFDDNLSSRPSSKVYDDKLSNVNPGWDTDIYKIIYRGRSNTSPCLTPDPAFAP